MEIDPIAAPVIRNIFDWYTSDCPSLLQVKTRLDEKIRTGEIDVDYTFSTSNLHRILSNTIYYGDFHWKGVQHHGTLERIVDKGSFLVEYHDSYGQLVTAADTARRRRSARLLRSA